MTRSKLLVAAIGVVILLFPMVTNGRAQGICMRSPDIYKSLSQDYGEVRIGTGLGINGELIEVWTNPESRSFSILVTLASGISCMSASGGSWDSYEIEHEPEIEGDPA